MTETKRGEIGDVVITRPRGGPANSVEMDKQRKGCKEKEETKGAAET